MCIIASSKWAKITRSMPQSLRMSSSRSAMVLSSGTAVPNTSVSGCVSKLSAAGVSPSACARCPRPVEKRGVAQVDAVKKAQRQNAVMYQVCSPRKSS